MPLGVAYFALVATGQNTYYTHYHRSTEVLRDGELVQFDYAPDYKYYQSDVTRVFPVNGRFTPRQREYYGIYLKLYQALLTSIAVHKTPAEVTATALGKMDAIMAAYPFTDDRIKAAAAKMIEALRARKNPRGVWATTSASRCTTSAACRPRPSNQAGSSPSSRRCASRTSTSACASRT